jgi:uncharacterized protein (TIGR02001 family)
MKFARTSRFSNFVVLPAVALLLNAGSALAQTATPAATPPAPAAAPAAEPAPPFTWNAGITTDYRYRGVSQSRLKPTINAGADYAFANGFYLGGWGSTIKWVKDGGGDGNLELDLYGGYKFEVAKDLNLDVGYLQYVYPSNKLSPSANTGEIYIGATYNQFNVKYSRSVSNLFGFANSKGSGYFDFTGTFDLGGGWGAIGHIGKQSVKNNSAFGYTDYKVGATKDIEGYVIGASLIGTDNKKYVSPTGKNLGKNGLVLTVSKTF